MLRNSVSAGVIETNLIVRISLWLDDLFSIPRRVRVDYRRRRAMMLMAAMQQQQQQHIVVQQQQRVAYPSATTSYPAATSAYPTAHATASAQPYPVATATVQVGARRV